MAIAQILMVITLLLMISGKTPFSMIVFIGTAIAAVVAGFPLTGGKDVVTITSFVVSGLNPVIADMAGVLMFIGMLTGFTQPVITAVIAGIGFVLGYPIFLIGVAAAILTIILSKTAFAEGEAAMLQGVGRVATPLVATIGFLFMSAVIKNVGLASLIGKTFMPILEVAPLQSMLFVSAIAGLITQSNAASAAIVLPFLQATLGAGANPLAAACMAAGGSAIMQYFLTGGPIAALATVIPILPGSDLKIANKFQRPSMLFGVLVLFVLSFVLNL